MNRKSSRVRTRGRHLAVTSTSICAAVLGFGLLLTEFGLAQPQASTSGALSAQSAASASLSQTVSASAPAPIVLGQPSGSSARRVGTAPPQPSATGTQALPTQAPPKPGVPASKTPPAVSSSTCTEYLPEGKARPRVVESFPSRGLSGHKAVLRVSIEHGDGEQVLPGGFQFQAQDDGAKRLKRAGFLFLDPESPDGPRVGAAKTSGGAAAVGIDRGSTVEIPVVPLPSEPGRSTLILPALPIAVSRASGEVVTLCTQPHTIEIEDPTANQPSARPKVNPSPRRQTELWVALRNAAYGLVGGLVLAALIAQAVRVVRRRPKVEPPPPPPRPAWEVALEELHDIAHAQLIEQGRFGDHFDRVSHTLRKYLGDRFGFDGTESTTREILERLSELGARGKPLVKDSLPEVSSFLEESDLVKFANVEPEQAQCQGLWERAKALVERTKPSLSSLVASSESTTDVQLASRLDESDVPGEQPGLAHASGLPDIKEHGRNTEWMPQEKRATPVEQAPNDSAPMTPVQFVGEGGSQLASVQQDEDEEKNG